MTNISFWLQSVNTSLAFFFKICFLIFNYSIFEIIINHFSLLFPPSKPSHLPLLTFFQIHGLLFHSFLLQTDMYRYIHIYSDIDTYNLLEPYSVTCMYDFGLAIWLASWRALPWGRLFLPLSTFLSCLQLSPIHFSMSAVLLLFSSGLGSHVGET